jgi:uncharacterized protein YkwD
MIKSLSSLILCIFFLTILSPHQAFASQKIHKQTNTSFFSFFENYLIDYTTSKKDDTNQILAAQTALPTVQILPTQTSQVPVQSAPQLSDVSSYIWQGVNDYRASLGLSQVQSSAETCAFAAIRAQEIATNGFTHDGFYNRVNNHTIPYSQWSHATENIAQAPDYHEVVTLWKNSPEHAANMRDNTPYVCIEQYQSYYAYEGMRP